MVKNKSYLRHLLKQYRAIVILYFALNLIVYPIWLLLQSVQSDPYHVMTLSFEPVSLAILMIILSAITPFIVFGFIYDKPKMDTYFSLPVKREKLFFSHFLFSWLITLIPLLVSLLLGFIVTRLAGPSYMIEQSTIGSYSFLQFLSWCGILIAGSLILQMPSMLAILSTTNLFNGFIYAFVLHLLPVTIQSVWNIFATGYYGYTPTQSYSGSDLKWLEFHTIYAESVSSYFENYYLLSIAAWFVIALLSLALCTWLFKRHKVERTNTSYMLKGFYPIMIAVYGTLLLVNMLGSTFSDFTGSMTKPFFLQMSFITIFLIGFVALFVVEIIRYHGLPKIWHTVVFYLLIFAVALGITFFLNNNVKLNLVKKMPNQSKLARVELVSATRNDDYYSDEKKADNLYVYPFDYVNKFSTLVLEDRPSMEEVLRIHQSIIDQHLKLNDGSDSVYYYDEYPLLRIRYLDKAGRELLVRTYGVIDKEIEKALTDLGLVLIEPYYYDWRDQ